jgi:hypothetical protein
VWQQPLHVIALTCWSHSTCAYSNSGFCGSADVTHKGLLLQAQLRRELGLPAITYPVPASAGTASALPPGSSDSSSGGGGSGVSGAVVGGIVAGVVVAVGLFAAVLGEHFPQTLTAWQHGNHCRIASMPFRTGSLADGVFLIAPCCFLPTHAFPSVQRSLCHGRGSGSGKQRQKRFAWRAPPAAPAWTARATGGVPMTPPSRSTSFSRLPLWPSAAVLAHQTYHTPAPG